MKIKYVFLSMLACGMVAACSNDEVAEGSNTTNLGGGEAYVKVRIAMSDGAASRATSGGYDNGSADEQKISSIRFAFFNDDDKLVTWGKNVGATIVTPNTPDQNVEGFAEAVVALILDEGDEMPTKVVAYVNGSPTVSTGTAFSTGVRNLETSTIGNTTDGFVMTSSTYWDNGEQIATSVAPGDFYETAEMATAAKNPVTIYVERLAAKVTVKEAPTLSSNIEDLQDSEGNVLKFTLKGYALTGLNTTEYYLKHLQDWSAWTWTWNNASDHRSFWAEDPNYTSMPSDKGLDFVSYNEVDDNNKQPQYCPENTLTAALYESDKFQACTSILVIGSYTVVNVDGESVTDADGTFYMYGGKVYSEINLKNQLANNGLVYTRTGNGTQESPYVYTSAEPSAYTLVRISGTNEVTLSLTQGATTYYTPNEEGTDYVEITDYTAFNATLAKQVGGAEKYNAGKTYFAVPIEHLATSGDGHIGVVRNHSYVLTLESIKGLGDGVYDPTEDIIPVPPTNKYYVGATLNILSWHVVNQSVNL